MKRKRLPKSVRKFLREEKARLRRSLSSTEAEEKIKELLARLRKMQKGAAMVE